MSEIIAETAVLFGQPEFRLLSLHLRLHCVTTLRIPTTTPHSQVSVAAEPKSNPCEDIAEQGDAKHGGLNGNGVKMPSDRVNGLDLVSCRWECNAS